MHSYSDFNLLRQCTEVFPSLLSDVMLVEGDSFRQHYEFFRDEDWTPASYGKGVDSKGSQLCGASFHGRPCIDIHGSTALAGILPDKICNTVFCRVRGCLYVVRDDRTSFLKACESSRTVLLHEYCTIIKGYVAWLDRVH